MKKLLRSPLIIFLIVLNILLVVVQVARRLSADHQKSVVATGETIKAGARFEKSGFISQSDYIHLVDAGQRMHVNGEVSDDDLKWCLSLLGRRPNGPKDNHLIPMQLMVSGRLLNYVKGYTSHQEDILYQFFVDSINQTSNATEADYLVAFSLMQKTKDKRAVPYLLPLLEDPRPKIKQGARNTLVSIRGYAGENK